MLFFSLSRIGKLEQVPVRVTVINEFTNEQLSYSTTVIEEGLMFGALNQLQDTTDDFKYSTKFYWFVVHFTCSKVIVV